MFNWNKVFIGGLIFMATLISGLAIGAPVQIPLPEVKAGYAELPPILDGKLDDPCWQQAGLATDFVEYQNKKPLLEKTVVYILYDKENLYIAFRGYESQIDKLVGTYTTENDPVFLDDSFEIFISPFMVTTDKNYYHFVANVLGTKYSMFHGEPMYGDPEMTLTWEVKTGKEANTWVAEFKIPFATLKAHGENDKYWRVNFCRNEIPQNETSSWSFCDSSFHNFDRFGKLTGIDINGKFITFRGDLQPMKATITVPMAPVQVQDAMVPQPKPIVVIPKPVYLKLLGKDLLIDKTTKIVIGNKPSKENAQAAAELNQEIEELAGFKLAIVPASKVQSGKLTNLIVLGEPWVNPISKKICNLENIAVTKSYPGDQGYVLRVTENYVIVSGSDPIGTYYGVQSLKQLLRINSDFSLVAKGAEIYDKPQFNYRCIHLLADKDSIWFHTRLIDRVLSRYKINHILYEVEQGIQWDSVPEINQPMAISKAEFKKVLQDAKDHFITVTPLVQTLGHLEFAFRDKKNMEFVEDSAIPYAYCPMNPKSYEFAFKMLDEAIQVFDHPEYLHIGHDEFEMEGKFPVHEDCKKIGVVDLYYMDTLKLYEHLKQKGVKTMMWGDIFLKEKFRTKIETLPKDIVIADWHYDPRTVYPSINFYQEHGFKTIGCTWYIPRNIEGFSQFCAKKNSYGMMQTTWTGYFGNATAMEKEFYQIYAYILAADYFWSPLPKKLGELPYDPAQVLRDRWEDSKLLAKPKPGVLFDLAPFATVSLVDSADKPGFLGYGPGNDLSGLVRSLQEGQIRLEDAVLYKFAEVNGIPAGIMLKGPAVADSFPQKVVGIPINRKVKEFSFLHTTGWSTKTDSKVGQYIIHYADGTNAPIDLLYAVNIHSWRDSVSTPQQTLAWKGKTQDKHAVHIRSYHWMNPNPDKVIATIDFLGADNNISPILLAITGLK